MIIVGICGGSGSGKSTVAKQLQNILPESSSVILAQDSYYRDLAHLSYIERTHINFDHPDSLEWDLLKQHLDILKSEKNASIPIYDFVSHTRQGATLVKPPSIIILEGHLIFHPTVIRELIDVKVFLKNELDTMLIRRLKRDTIERGRTVASVLEQYINTVRPMYFDFVAHSEEWADIAFNSETPIKIIALIIKDIIKNFI